MVKAGQKLKLETIALYLALKDPELGQCVRGWGARILIVLVLVVGLGPLDFVPEFAPLMAVLMDMIVLPLLMWLAVRVAPIEPLERARARAAGGYTLTLQLDWPLGLFVWVLWLLNAVVMVKVIAKHAGEERWVHKHQDKLMAVTALVVTLVFAFLVLWRLNVEEQQQSQQQQGGQGQPGVGRAGGGPPQALGADEEAGAPLDPASEVEPLLAQERPEGRT